MTAGSVARELGALAQAGDAAAAEVLLRWIAAPELEHPLDAAALRELAPALGAERLLFALRRACEALAAEEGGGPRLLRALDAAATLGGDDVGRLLLDVFDRGDASGRELVAAVLDAARLRAAGDGAEQRAEAGAAPGPTARWLERLERHVDEPCGPPLARVVAARRDPGADLALLRLARAPERALPERLGLAGEAARWGGPELALALVQDYWSSRESADAAVPLAAAAAAFDNSAVAPEELTRAVVPIAADLLAGGGKARGREALALLAHPRLGTRESVALLVEHRAALSQAGLRRDVTRALEQAQRNLRRNLRAASRAPVGR